MMSKSRFSTFSSLGWLTIVKGNEVMQSESDVEGGGSDDKENENQTLEDEEWNDIGNDDENDSGSKDWETENDEDEDEEDEDDEGDEKTGDSFKEGIVDVSDSEILYDKDRNIIGEEDIGGRLKEIMKYHMSKLREKLDMFATLASTEAKDEDEEDAQTRGEMDETS